VFRFAGFELDQQRAELRRPDGRQVKLRPKTLEMLQLFAANAGRVLSKHELMEAVWPNIHVGEDSLFQCIRELRTALGDDRRQMIRVVSGRGYVFDIEVSTGPADVVAETEAVSPAMTASVEPAADATIAAEQAKPRRPFGLPTRPIVSRNTRPIIWPHSEAAYRRMRFLASIDSINPARLSRSPAGRTCGASFMISMRRMNRRLPKRRWNGSVRYMESSGRFADDHRMNAKGFVPSEHSRCWKI